MTSTDKPVQIYRNLFVLLQCLLQHLQTGCPTSSHHFTSTSVHRLRHVPPRNSLSRPLEEMMMIQVRVAPSAIDNIVPHVHVGAQWSGAVYYWITYGSQSSERGASSLKRLSKRYLRSGSVKLDGTIEEGQKVDRRSTGPKTEDGR